jgi:hypothetical protein
MAAQRLAGPESDRGFPVRSAFPWARRITEELQIDAVPNDAGKRESITRPIYPPICRRFSDGKSFYRQSTIGLPSVMRHIYCSKMNTFI